MDFYTIKYMKYLDSFYDILSENITTFFGPRNLIICEPLQRFYNGPDFLLD